MGKASLVSVEEKHIMPLPDKESVPPPVTVESRETFSLCIDNGLLLHSTGKTLSSPQRDTLLPMGGSLARLSREEAPSPRYRESSVSFIEIVHSLSVSS